MKNLISVKQIKTIIFITLGIFLLTHILVIAGIVPHTIFWTEEIEIESILPLELIAIVFLFSFSLIILIKLKYLKDKQPNKMINIGLWFIVLYFLIGSFSNFSSEIKLENLLLGILSLVMAFTTFRLSLEK